MAKQKILTILGTRPEIIRLSRVIPLLDEIYGRDHHKILHTGQNYDPNLNDIFFRELGLRSPDFVSKQVFSGLADQLAGIFQQVESAIQEFNPDRALILGDTNSGLAAIICERSGIPVYHMEAGNRCYDRSVPEERNRRVIDAVASYNLPYTEISRQNLLREGLDNNKIYLIGNPIAEVLDYYQPQIDSSDILSRLSLGSRDYVIATAHRAENVDCPNRLQNIFKALTAIANDLPVIFSCHPKTQQRLNQLNIDLSKSNVKILNPLGFFDFVHLEQQSFCAITDSGTVQEEMCLFHRPTITIRESTERPETVWCGSNVISGLDPHNIVECYRQLSNGPYQWACPEGYANSSVSSKVVKILSSHIRSL